MPVAAASVAGTLLRHQIDVTLEEVEDNPADPPANWASERQRGRPKTPDYRSPPTLNLHLPKATGSSLRLHAPHSGSNTPRAMSPCLIDSENEVWREPPRSPRRMSFQQGLHQNMKASHQPGFSALHGILNDQRKDFDIAMKKGSKRVMSMFEEIVSENARLNCLLVAAGVPQQTSQGHPNFDSSCADLDDSVMQKGISNQNLLTGQSALQGALVHVQPCVASIDSIDGTELTPVLPLDAHDGTNSLSGKRMFCAAETLDSENSCSMDNMEDEQKERYIPMLPRRSEDYTPAGGFNLLSVWQDMNPAKLGWSRKVKQPTVVARMMTKFIEDEEKEEERREGTQANRPRCVIHPNSTIRAVWDLLSLSIVVYDMAAIPVQLFNPPENSFSSTMIWVTRIFWTVDMPLSLISGYVQSDGVIQLKHKAIIRQYLRTWFPLDVLIVGVDWLELVLQASSVLGVAKAGKAARVIRIMRMIRLLRLVRMREVFSMFTERITSEKVIITLDICRLMLLILGIAHFFACLWYGVGDQDGPQTWIHRHGYHRVGLGEAYLMSLHWSLSQFAGGMDEVTPKNASERLFTVVVFIFAFIMASVFVSSLTSSMTQLKHMSSHQAQQLSVLRRYLRQHRISSRLGLRVQRSAVSALQERQRFMPEDGVQLLKLVSEPLCVEIHTQIYTPLLSVHPFFKAYQSHVPQVMRKVCHSATSFMMVSNGDVIFSAGESPPHPKMYFVVHGSLTYHPFDGVSTTVHELSGGHWLAEATLWTEWIHHGLLKATTECRLCVLDAKRFQNIVIQFEHSDFNPKSYALEFILSLNNSEEVNDLPVADLPVAHLKKTASSAFDRVTWRFRDTRISTVRLSKAPSAGFTGAPSTSSNAGLRRITEMGDAMSNKIVRFVSRTED